MGRQVPLASKETEVDGRSGGGRARVVKKGENGIAVVAVDVENAQAVGEEEGFFERDVEMFLIIVDRSQFFLVGLGDWCGAGALDGRYNRSAQVEFAGLDCWRESYCLRPLKFLNRPGFGLTGFR